MFDFQGVLIAIVETSEEKTAVNVFCGLRYGAVMARTFMDAPPVVYNDARSMMYDAVQKAKAE